jgi:demethylmenaquinone methyltransferase/2-methoxy-6-polyprenyl-1,4-benzoquinol methylase
MSARETTVDKSARRVQTMFGEIAPKYDFLNNLLSFGLAKRWRRRFVRTVFARLAERSEVSERLETLDVATGTGDVIAEETRQWTRRKLADKLGVGEFRPVGVDFVPQMLELARKKVAAVEFIEADGCALPFDDERFDAVTISFGLRNMVDPAKGIAEMARVCRKGGVVAILEFSPTKFPLFAPLFRFDFHRVLPAIGDRLMKNRSDAYRYLPESVDAFDSSEKVLEYMRAAGLKTPTRRAMTFGVLGMFVGVKE